MPRPVNITRLKKRIDTLESNYKEINSILTTKQNRPQIRCGKYSYNVKKAIINPNFTNKTVLTDSTWDYVLTYMQNKKNSDDAIFYWEQAMNFYEATKNLSLIASPLTTYYCFLNATKSLLEFKGVPFNFKHGVSGKRVNGRIKLQNEMIKIHTSGVLSGLCTYFGESVNVAETYNLKDMLYNLPYIHRAYTLSYKSDTELFIPINSPRFVYDPSRKKGWFEAHLEREYSNRGVLNKLSGFSADRYYSFLSNYVVRRSRTFTWDCTRNNPSEKSILAFNKYYKNLRNKLHYIYSPNELWYLKRNDLASGTIIDKNTIIITMAAMHRLSELSRYEPQILKLHLEKEQSWLLREFINKSIVQFVDNISSEITGDDFRQTGFRT